MDTEGVFLWLCDVSPLNVAQVFSSCLKRVPVWRQQKALRYKRVADRVRSLGASLLLGHALRQVGLDWDTAAVRASASGRLECCGTNSVSISHSGNMAACAVWAGMQNNALGVDVEQFHAISPSVSQRVCTLSEQNYVQDMSAGGQGQEAFFYVWTRKEACLKACGQGLRLEPASVDVVHDVTGKVVLPDGSVWYTRSYPLEGYALALCLQHGDFPVQAAWYTISA